MEEQEILLLDRVSSHCTRETPSKLIISKVKPNVNYSMVFFLIGFSNITIYVSSQNLIEKNDILDLKNLTTMKEDMEDVEFRAELKKFTSKYPLCGSYIGLPTLDDQVIDIDCYFPFETRYVLILKNSIFEPTHLTVNDIQFRLKGVLQLVINYN